MQEFLANPIVRGVLTGVIAAAAVDFAAFRSWKSFNDAATYGWGVAAWRWFQGAIVGLMTAAGLGGVSWSFLSKLGAIALQVSKVAPIVGPIVSAVIPSATTIVTRATGEIDQIAGIIANVEVMGQALQLPGPQKLTAATPLIAQMVLQSSAVAGREIANPELFKAGCEKMGSGMADVLNSLKADAA